MLSPKFTITNAMLKYITQIETAKEIIENSPLVPFWERQFREEKALRQIHHSTKLEGNMLSLDEVERVLDGQQVTAKRREVQEIINYRKVIDFINAYDRSKPFTVDTLCEIHAILVENILPNEWAGTFRTANVVIQASDTRQITHRAPEFEQVPGLITELVSWINEQSASDLHPILKSGIFHAVFAKVHPFVEANGRTARAAATLLLYIDGYDFKKFFSLDEYYDQDPLGYYLALQSMEHIEDDMTTWLEFFSEGLAVELERVKQRVLEMSREYKLRKERGQIALSDRQEIILKFLEQHERIRNQDWRELLPDVSDDSILRDLKDLMDKELVVKKGKTKAAYYELVEK